MISWLEGKNIDTWAQGVKQGIVLACSGIGYEIQLLPREVNTISVSNVLTLWIHQIQREDGVNLYGFKKKSDRNLFRLLIGVSGIGPQIGIALLEGARFEEIVNAIISGDIDTLTKAQGIGKRIAERLCTELRHKVSDFSDLIEENQDKTYKTSSNSQLNLTEIKDLRCTLKSLGYEDLEINRAIKQITSYSKEEWSSESGNSSQPIKDPEELLKSTLLWLSQKAA